ncbi:protein phosphatase 1 regulatory subunit 3G isoform X2 [Hippocampus comes]|uniref:Protein phosphatase 1 regulatory subunit 3G n=1 Tax=Hippocampus comes TaxID=109280 RepID=A0A3Q2Z288_HIPCM|nr:PREDICTED: protein phosphatase 1 regulatory subunit 3G isoform X2 [Hippocampus comes]
MDREPDPDDDDDDRLDDEQDARQLERRMSERRRARSLPACPASLLLAAAARSEQRKRVQFADSLGLSLASVKHFSALDEPRVPTKVFSRHTGRPAGGGRHSQPAGGGRLVACFSEPADPDSRLRLQRVCLEGLSVTHFDVRGHVRVLSGSARGEVGVRYTFNEWLSHVDAQALLLDAQPPAGGGARYGFTVYTPPEMEAGAAVHLAVYFRSDQGDFWDNNDGRNFTLRYCAPALPPPEPHDRCPEPAADRK